MLASQARRRGFESLHPLHSHDVEGSPLARTLEQLIFSLLDDQARRRMMLRSKPNRELFELYKAELALRIRNRQNLSRYRQTLDQFEEFLADEPPSSVAAKSFLSRWGGQKPTTISKYASIIKGFLAWYGVELDLKIKVPHELPEYVEDEDIWKMIEAVRQKKTHKRSIERDILLIKLLYYSGLRREEAANLKVSNILTDEQALIVRKGKGGKDRTVPLPSPIFTLLKEYVAEKKPDASVFNLKPVSISYLVHRIARSAGVNVHAHSLRHGYATRLLEKGANIKAVQELLGHSMIGTTEGYLSLLPRHLRAAVDLLDAGAAESTTDKEQDNLKTTATDGSGHNGEQPGQKTTQNVYEETQHKQKMRDVARAISQNITLPSYRNKELWRELRLDFKRKEYFLSLGTVKIDNGKIIGVNYPDVFAGHAEIHLIDGIRNHLRTSEIRRFSEIVKDRGILDSLADTSGRYSQQLLTLLSIITENVKSGPSKVWFHSEQKPGLTKEFILTIWSDALENAGDHEWISDSWYKPCESIPGTDLRQLKCGGYVIGIARSDKKLDEYKQWHNKLRAEYASDPLTREINHLERQMTTKATGIRQRLLEFADMEYLPGHCNLCQYTR